MSSQPQPSDNLPATTTPTAQAMPLVAPEPQSVFAMTTPEGVKHAVQQRAKLLHAAVAATEQGDWFEFGKKPWLSADGAQRLAAVLGLLFEFNIEPLITRPDGHFEAVVKGRVCRRLPDGTLQDLAQDIGYARSRDPFFVVAYRWEPDPKRPGKDRKVQYEKKPDEISAGDVIKKAVANARTRCLCAALGISGLDWDALAEYGILRPDQSRRVSFSGNRRGDNRTPRNDSRQTKARPQDGKPTEKRSAPPDSTPSAADNPPDVDDDNADADDDGQDAQHPKVEAARLRMVLWSKLLDYAKKDTKRALRVLDRETGFITVGAIPDDQVQHCLDVLDATVFDAQDDDSDEE